MKYLAISLGLLAASAFGQGVPTTATIEGKITDCKTGEGIPGVHYFAFDRKGQKVELGKHHSGNGQILYEFITDAIGEYQIRNVPAGLITLHFSRLEYAAHWYQDTGTRVATRVLETHPGEKLKLNLCLEKKE